MKKTVKTSEILNVYNIINGAKYGKMDDADKVKVWKICRKLKPVATKFDEDSKDAAEKMKPQIEGGFDEVLAKAQEYERLTAQHQPTIDVMTKADYDKFIEEFKNYQKLVNDAIKEFADKEVEVEFDVLTEESFGKLLSSNEWNIGQASIVGEVVCE
jgi:hypothetical protein